MIWQHAELARAIEIERMRGHTVALVNGCFDLFHAGHVGLLEHAARVADIVVVALDDDEGVRRLKGSGRPVNRLEDRARVVAGCRYVNYVTSFAGGGSLIALMKRIDFEVLVKGEEYRLKRNIVGSGFVCRVEFAPQTHSSSDLIGRFSSAMAPAASPDGPVPPR